MRKILLTVTLITVFSVNVYSQYGRGDIVPTTTWVGIDYGLSASLNIADDFYAPIMDIDGGFGDMAINTVQIEPNMRYFIAFSPEPSPDGNFFFNADIKVGYEKLNYKILGTKYYMAGSVPKPFEYKYDVSYISPGFDAYACLSLLNEKLSIGLGVGVIAKIPLGEVPTDYAGMETERIEQIGFGIVPQARVSFELVENMHIAVTYGLEKHITDAYFGVSEGFGLKYGSSFVSLSLGYTLFGRD